MLGTVPGKGYVKVLAGDPFVPGPFGSTKREEEDQEKESPQEIFPLHLKPSRSPLSSSMEICLSRRLPRMFSPL